MGSWSPTWYTVRAFTPPVHDSGVKHFSPNAEIFACCEPKNGGKLGRRTRYCRQSWSTSPELGHQTPDNQRLSCLCTPRVGSRSYRRDTQSKRPLLQHGRPTAYFRIVASADLVASVVPQIGREIRIAETLFRQGRRRVGSFSKQRVGITTVGQHAPRPQWSILLYLGSETYWRYPYLSAELRPEVRETRSFFRADVETDLRRTNYRCLGGSGKHTCTERYCQNGRRCIIQVREDPQAPEGVRYSPHDGITIFRRCRGHRDAHPSGKLEENTGSHPIQEGDSRQ